MKKILALILLCVILSITGQTHASNGGIVSFSAADPYCGDDICSPDESCDKCRWDCGVCEPLEDEGGSGGGLIGVAPKKKNVTIFNGQEYLDYPIEASTYSKSGENATTIRLSMVNPYSSSTGAFRLHLEATASWFDPKNFSYALDPDGYTKDGWPYWDIYPLEQNESIEIAFLTQGIIGSTSLIDIKAQPISRWGTKCSSLLPDVLAKTNATADAIARYIFSLKETRDVTLYFEKKEANTTLALVLIGSDFGVFKINNTNVSAVSDNDTIAGLVRKYVSSRSPGTTVNVSKPYEIIEYSKNVSAGPQKSCFLITGMDRNKCVDRTSCFYSCFSVPVCSYIANGWEFIDTMHDYKETVDAADKKFNKSLESTYAFKKAPSYDLATTALEDMEELNKAETKVFYHSLFTVYNFCQPADYAIPNQIEARRILLDYLDENCLKGEEKKIINQSIQFASKLEVVEKNISVGNISKIPDILINDTNMTNVTTTNQSRDGIESECCRFRVCSVFGIEKIWGLCWELWIAILALLIISIAVLLKRRKIQKKRKG